MLKKILIIRLSSIGDIVLTSPLLRILKKNFPDTNIDFLIRTEYAELMKYNPSINNLIEINTSSGFKELQRIAELVKNSRYDLILDLHNNFRSNYIKLFSKSKYYTVNKRIIKRFLLIKLKLDFYHNETSVVERYIETGRFLNIKNDGNGLDLYYPDDIKLKIQDKIKAYELEKFDFVIGVAPSAKHYTKIWPADKFSDLLSKIMNNFNAFVFLLGSDNEANYVNDIAETVKSITNKSSIVNMAGKLTLLETAALLDKCKVLITNDTGLMHIAAARKRKVLAIFGSTVRQLGFFPYGTDNIVIENNNLKCRPCTHIGRKKCPKKHFMCMKDISVDKVFSAFKNILNIK